MEWLKAESSMFKFYRWIPGPIVDGVEFGTLEIEWNGGTKGAYLEVNRRTFDDFETAASKGRFLNASIKPTFKYKKLEEPKDAENGEEGAQTDSGEEEGSKA